MVPSEETLCDIERFIGVVKNELSLIPYPMNYRVSQHWRMDLDTAFTKFLYLHGNDIVRFAMTGVGFGGELSIVSPEWVSIRKDCEAYYPELYAIEETPLADSAWVSVLDDGRRTSPSVEIVLDWYTKIRHTVGDAQLKYVLEIGAGIGRTARVMYLLGVRCYVIVDLPESLAFSYAFLRANFPNSKIGVVHNASEAQVDLEKFDFVFCPVQLFQYLNTPELDLFLSTYSLGEMPQPTVDHIMEHVHRLRPKFVFSENIILTDKTLHYDAGNEEANEIALPVRPEWYPTLFEFKSEYIDHNHRFIGCVGLRRFEGTFEELVSAFQERLKGTWAAAEDAIPYLYFLAQWIPHYVQLLITNLTGLCYDWRITGVNVQDIGEVKYLLRGLG
jgi:SAM-dependent methyltransferase